MNPPPLPPPPLPTRGSPPPLPSPQRRSRRVPVWVPVLLLGASVLAAVAWLADQTTRADTPEHFASLCRALYPEMLVLGEPVVLPTVAEQELEAQRRRELLRQVAAEGRSLGSLSRNILAIEQESLRIADEGPKITRGILSGIQLALGLSFASQSSIEQGSMGLAHELVLTLDYLGKLGALETAMQVQQVALFHHAPRFSGPVRQDNLLGHGFGEERPHPLREAFGWAHSFDGTQTLALHNQSGQALTGCVIQVRLVKVDGTSFLHYFACETWPADQVRFVQFTPGLFELQTSKDVHVVDIQFHAREASLPPLRIKRPGEAWTYLP